VIFYFGFFTLRGFFVVKWSRTLFYFYIYARLAWMDVFSSNQFISSLKRAGALLCGDVLLNLTRVQDKLCSRTYHQSPIYPGAIGPRYLGKHDCYHLYKNGSWTKKDPPVKFPFAPFARQFVLLLNAYL